MMSLVLFSVFNFGTAIACEVFKSLLKLLFLDDSSPWLKSDVDSIF